MIIRQAEEHDMPALMRIEAECFGAEKFTPETVLAFVVRDDTFVLVALEEGEAIGSAMCLASEMRREGKIASIAVLEGHRRRGVGSSLLGECEDAFRTYGLLKYTLEVETTNEAAIALYSRNGYEVKATLLDFYGAGRNAHYMEKVLVPSRQEVKVRSA